ncbi:MAG: YIP1 family protein [Haloferacaceae archaeon]
MSYARRWSMLTKHLLFKPGFFFENFNVRESYGFPIAYATVSAFVGVGVLAALSFVLNLADPANALVGSAVLLALFVPLTILSFGVRVLVAHAIVYAFGERGLQRTLEAFAYPTVVTMTTAYVPLLNLVGGLYGLYLQTKGVARFHGLSDGKALVAVLLSGVLSFALTLAIVFVLFVTFLASLLGLGGLAAAGAL